MRTRSLALVVVGIALAATTHGCTAELDVLGPAEGQAGAVACGGGPGCGVEDACNGAGDPCAAPDDCCSGSCVEDGARSLVCESMALCTTSAGSECALQAGEPCDNDAACCTGACVPANDGVSRCAYLGGCHLECELCVHDGDCCSQHCAADASGVRRCTAAPVLDCRPAGELCDSGADCCAGTSCGKVSPPEEPRRCHQSAVLADGSPCALPGDCAGGHCVPDDEGTLLCESGCRAEGRSCTSRADCCQMLTHDCLPVGGIPTCVDLFE